MSEHYTWWLICVVSIVGWWILASALLYFTWNKVVKGLTKVKSAKFWQALLVVATIAVLCAPSHYGKKQRWGYRHKIRHSEFSGSECPYAQSGGCPYAKTGGCSHGKDG